MTEVDAMKEAADAVAALRTKIDDLGREIAILRALVDHLIHRVEDAGYGPLATLLRDDVKGALAQLDEGKTK